MTFGALATWLLPLIPALVLLYFLKLRRREVIVSSTYLWKKSLDDLHVNAPFQRLRRSLLLLLQLLILLSLIAAASRPIISGLREQGATRVLLIDNSASMNVEERDGTRLEIAVEKALSLVGSMDENDRTGVIVFSDRPEIVQPLTGDRSRLREVLESIEPTANPTDFGTALAAAEPLARSDADAEVFIFSDGAFGKLAQVAPELERLNLRFVPIGTDRPNLGIVELDVNRDFSRSQRVQIFVSVLNASSPGSPSATTVKLYDEDRLLDAATLEIEPGDIASHIFDGTSHPGRILRLELDRGGALGDDDVGWVRVDPPRPVNLLLVGSQWFLEKLVRIRPLLAARRVSLSTYRAMAEDGRLEADPADVIVFNGQAPRGPPDRPALYLGCYPAIPELLGDGPGADGKRTVAGDEVRKVKRPTIVDQDQVHPVNHFVNLAEDLLISESLVMPTGSRYHSIVDSEAGSIGGTLILTPSGRPTMSLLVLGFDIGKTNWPWLPSFPMFFSNALTWLASAGRNTADQRYRTGETLVSRVNRRELSGDGDAVSRLSMRDPAGGEHPLQFNRSAEVSFTETGMCGVYELRDGDEILERFPVSLLRHRETRVAPGERIEVGSAGVAETAGIPTSKELWKWFAGLGLVAVLLEWWVYNRKMTL